MTNCLIQNLGYLYELTLDKPTRERKIKVLEGVAFKTRLDDMDPKVFGNSDGK